MDPLLFNAVAAIAVAVLASLSTWAVAQRKSKVDTQTSLNDGFALLINQLQEERHTALEVRGKIFSELQLSHETKALILKELQQSRQMAQLCQSELHIELRGLRVDIKGLEANTRVLEALLHKHKIDFTTESR